MQTWKSLKDDDEDDEDDDDNAALERGLGTWFRNRKILKIHRRCRTKMCQKRSSDFFEIRFWREFKNRNVISVCNEKTFYCFKIECSFIFMIQ